MSDTVSTAGIRHRRTAGLVVGGEDGWRVRKVESASRVRQLNSGSEYLAAARTTMDRLQDRLDAITYLDEDGSAVDEYPSAVWLEHLASTYRNVVQFTRPAPAVADSVDDTMAMLAEQLLIEPEHRSLVQTRNTARSALGRSLKQRLHRRNIAERPTLIAGDEQRTMLDFAVVNGPVRQLSHAWSFRSGDPEVRAVGVRAWAWVIDTLRDEGGILRIEG